MRLRALYIIKLELEFIYKPKPRIEWETAEYKLQYVFIRV